MNIRGKRGFAPYVLEFSDRFFALDWGEVADSLQGKAEASAFLAWFFFDHLGRPESWRDAAVFSAFAGDARLQRLAREGLDHHMIGLGGGDLQPLTLEREILAPSKMLLVRALSYPDDEARDEQSVDRVLPFAVRFSMEGSSQNPVVSFMGGEAADETLSPAVAIAKGRLSAAELDDLAHLTKLIALRLAATCKDVGVDLSGGLLRFAVQGVGGAVPRDFMLVDALGLETLDVSLQGIPLSLSLLNDSYRGSNWVAAVEKAKAMAQDRGERDWKRICIEEFKAQPPLLSPMLKEKAVMMHQSFARALSQRSFGKAVFSRAWDMAKLAAALAPRPRAA